MGDIELLRQTGIKKRNMLHFLTGVDSQNMYEL